MDYLVLNHDSIFVKSDSYIVHKLLLIFACPLTLSFHQIFIAEEVYNQKKLSHVIHELYNDF